MSELLVSSLKKPFKLMYTSILAPLFTPPLSASRLKARQEILDKNKVHRVHRAPLLRETDVTLSTCRKDG